MSVAYVACGNAAAGGDRLLVAAASDLALALPEIVEAFRAETGIEVDVTYGSSGQIAYQIEHGAPVDVFLSADAEPVARLASMARIDSRSVAVYARGVLAVVAGANSPIYLRDIEDLRDERVRRIAIANPEHAPYGRAAKQTLEDAGLWEELAPRIVMGENIRHAMQYVETGAVEAAIGARPLVREEAHRWFVVSQHRHAPLDQTIAIVASTRRPAAAEAFADFVLGPAGREILLRHGFLPPGGAGPAAEPGAGADRRAGAGPAAEPGAGADRRTGAGPRNRAERP